MGEIDASKLDPVTIFGATFFAPASWTFPEWVTVIGLPLALVALWLARGQSQQARQLTRETRDVAKTTESIAAQTKDVAKATGEAVARTEQHLADNHLLIMLPRLLQMRRELDLAVRLGQVETTIDTLSDWLEISSELHEILINRDADHDHLVHLIERSASLTSKAKDSLIEDKQPVVEATSETRAVVNDVCIGAGRIMGGMKAFTRGSGTDA